MRGAILLAALAMVIGGWAVGGCTVVRINKGDTNTIDHKAGAGVAEDLAARACHRAGGQSAEIISTQNKDAKLPPGTGTQRTTFRCTTAKR